MPKTLRELVEEAAKKSAVESDNKKEIEKLNGLMYFVVVVLFIGFALALITLGGFIQSYFSYRAATYQDLVDKVNEQSTKTNLLYEELNKNNSNLDQTNSDLIKLKTYFGIK